MDRNQAKELLPIIKAFSEGKGIETKTDCCWRKDRRVSGDKTLLD